MTRVDIGQLKHEIHVFGRILGMKEAKATDADLEAIKQRRPALLWTDYKTKAVSWNYGAVLKHYVKLVAFRSQLRGKLHFAPSTNLEEAHFILGVPCIASTKTTNGWHHVFRPITLEVQGEWVKDLYEEFALKEDHQRVA